MSSHTHANAETGLSTDTTNLHELPDVRAGIHLLARLARVAERTCLEAGVSLPQYRLLVSAGGAPQRASELAEAVGVSRPTLTSLVDGLEEAGLVRRVPEPTDRRGIRLELTGAGREARREAELALTTRLVSLVESDLPEVMDLATILIQKFQCALDREMSGH